MENYNLEAYEGKHKGKITIQYDNFKGHIYFVVGGNCKGRSIIETGADYFELTCDNEIGENDCELHYDDDMDTWSCVLSNADGELLQIENESSDMDDMIVSVEIISYETE